MRPYKLFFMNACTGHIDRLSTVEARDDAEAISIAMRSKHRPLEVWDNNRKVHRLEDARSEEDAAYLGSQW